MTFKSIFSKLGPMIFLSSSPVKTVYSFLYSSCRRIPHLSATAVAVFLWSPLSILNERLPWFLPHWTKPLTFFLIGSLRPNTPMKQNGRVFFLFLFSFLQFLMSSMIIFSNTPLGLLLLLVSKIFYHWSSLNSKVAKAITRRADYAIVRTIIWILRRSCWDNWLIWSPPSSC